jgi:flavodoxin
MKTLIIYKSVHHGNTEKIAKVMADALEAELLDLKDADGNTIKEYDLIGFGSGVYFYKPHKKLRKFIEGLDNVENKKAFVFSTSGAGKPEFNKWLKENLSNKGFEVVGEFHCKGFDTYGLTKLIGGINKGKPDGEDLKNAKNFANGLKVSP